MYVAQLAP